MKRYTSEAIKEFISKAYFDERVILNKDPLWPKISIVTPSYGQGQFIERTIFSVLNQNYPNLEYIIIDGGSRDKSVEIIKKHEKYLTYWVSEPDNGQSSAINKGFKIATGDIIAWQNSDDIYLPDAFFRVAEEFRKYRDCCIAFGNTYLIDENDNIIKNMRFVPFNLEHLIYYDWNLSSQAVFWSRKLFDKVGYFKNYEVLFDWDWFIRVGRSTKNFRFIRTFFGAYRIHLQSKFTLIKDDIREPILVEILCENGIAIDEKRDWAQQYRFKKFKAFLRKFIWYILQGDIDYIFQGAVRRIQCAKPN